MNSPWFEGSCINDLMDIADKHFGGKFSITCRGSEWEVSLGSGGIGRVLVVESKTFVEAVKNITKLVKE